MGQLEDYSENHHKNIKKLVYCMKFIIIIFVVVSAI